MANRIGIRREDKNAWERRVPLSPTDIGALNRTDGIEFSLQPMPNRAFSDAEYMAVGATIDENLTGCDVILAIKEMPLDFFRKKLTYVFFSHVIKGQDYNMPMLQRIMDLGCNLIDYEKITDDKNFRLVFFGSEAGQAGMIDTLWLLGRRLTALGISNPFIGVRQAIDYRTLTAAESAIETVGQDINANGVPDEIHPVIFGFAGYGNVSKGAQGILHNLPVIEISPEELLNPPDGLLDSKKHVYQVVFKEEHMVDPKDPENQFVLQDYYDHPEKYNGVFAKFIPHLTVLMNCIYWSEDYPRLFTKEHAKELYSGGQPKLVAIGDISIDVEGAVEVSLKATDSGNPVYVYDVDSGNAVDGVEGNGPAILAVDNLPCELPREASSRFSGTLKPFIPDLANADFSQDLDSIDLRPSLKRAVIVHKGKLTPDFEYITEFLGE